MILPDVSILVYAFRPEADRHDDYRLWLDETLAGQEDLALVEAVLLGFVRIVTNPRVFDEPAPTPVALGAVERLRQAVPARPLAATGAAWARFRDIAENDHHVRGNLVPDAWLAALALTAGARIATSDAGFRRFPGVHSFDPGR